MVARAAAVTVTLLDPVLRLPSISFGPGLFGALSLRPILELLQC